MAKKKKNRGLYLVTFALFFAGVAYLIGAGIANDSVYFLNVSEALAMPSDTLHSARLFGTVKAEGLSTLEGTPGITFQLEDKDNAAQTLWVTYKGALPDTFKPGAEVIVEGSLEQGHTFKAETLMTKCPSKYQKENRG